MPSDLTKRVGGLVCIVVFVFVVVYFLKTGASSSTSGQAAKVSVSIRNVLKGQSRDSGSGFWIAYDASNVETLSPSNLAVYVHAVNNTSDPIKVVTQSAQLRLGEAWVELAPIPFGSSHTPYFGFSSEALQPVIKEDSPTGSVSLQVNSETRVLPKGELQGWAIFEYPDHVKDTENATVRVTLSTDSGETFSAEASKADIAAMGRVPINVGHRIDLSRLRFGWYSKLYGRGE